MSMIRPSRVIAIIVACAILYGVRAQSPAPAPGPDCVTALTNSADCLTYVQAGSNLSAPDKACCPEIASLVDNYPICLCELLGGAASSYGIMIDTARALKLPSICNVTTPPVSTCAVLGIPIASPMSPSMAPGSEYPSTGGGPQLPAGSIGSPASPPSGNHGNPCFRGIEIMLAASFSFIVAVVGVL